MTADTANGAGTVDDPVITVHLHDARDTLWALDFIGEWLDYANADTHDDLHSSATPAPGTRAPRT